MNWLLCDFGEVLSLPQEPGGVERLAAMAGMTTEGFGVAYYRERLAYDRGDLSAADYWTGVLGERPGDALQALIDIDAGSWTRPNVPTLEAVGRAADRGLRLAVLSNMPAEIAAIVDGLDWVAVFEPRIFSFELRLVKPEPAIYLAALDRLGAGPQEVTFVDDKAVNVAAARGVGLRAERFEGPATFDRIPGAADGP